MARTLSQELDRARRLLVRLDDGTRAQIAQDYKRVWADLSFKLKELTDLIAETKDPNVSWLVNQARFHGFMDDLERETRDFLEGVEGTVSSSKATAAGLSDRATEEMVARQLAASGHAERVERLLLEWKERPALLRDAITAELEGWKPGRGGISQQDTRSLIWEFQQKARENPVTLYRGARGQDRGPRSWTEDRARAERYAARIGLGQGRVEEAPPGSLRGLSLSDYVKDPYKESEWIIPDEKTMKADVPPPREMGQAEVFVRGTFTRMNPRWIQLASQRTKAGTPLRRLLEKAAGDGVELTRNTLISGVARGQSMRALAKDVARAAQMPQARALTIARTEVLGIYRDAATQSMRASSVVNGWIWDAALDERTCVICWEMNGEAFPDSEPLDSHVNCRCVQVAQTLTWEELGLPGIEDTQPALDIPPGRDEFAKLPSGAQRSILGPTRYNAYQQGKVSLGDMVRQTSSPVWGRGLRQATVSELGL